MGSLKRFLFIALFFAACSPGLNAQNLVIVLDSLHDFRHGNTAFTSIPIYNNDSVYIYCRVFNFMGRPIHPDSLSFGGFCNDTSTGSDSSVNTNLSRRDTNTAVISDSVTVKFVLALLNTSTNPIPNLVPSGNSVVIWPIYGATLGDSTAFILNWNKPSAITGPGDLYNFIGYNEQNIWIQFSNDELRIVELYDATGRRILQHTSTSLRDEIDWSNLPDAPYILYIRNDEQSVGIKLLHLGW